MINSNENADAKSMVNSCDELLWMLDSMLEMESLPGAEDVSSRANTSTNRASGRSAGVGVIGMSSCGESFLLVTAA